MQKYTALARKLEGNPDKHIDTVQIEIEDDYNTLQFLGATEMEIQDEKYEILDMVTVDIFERDKKYLWRDLYHSSRGQSLFVALVEERGTHRKKVVEIALSSTSDKIGDLQVPDIIDKIKVNLNNTPCDVLGIVRFRDAKDKIRDWQFEASIDLESSSS